MPLYTTHVPCYWWHILSLSRQESQWPVDVGCHLPFTKTWNGGRLQDPGRHRSESQVARAWRIPQELSRGQSWNELFLWYPRFDRPTLGWTFLSSAARHCPSENCPQNLITRHRMFRMEQVWPLRLRFCTFAQLATTLGVCNLISREGLTLLFATAAGK